MRGLHQIETIIILLGAVLALTTVARKLLIPYPIFLVIGGLVLGLVPGLPTIRLDPDLIFLVFLPPILWQLRTLPHFEIFGQTSARSHCWPWVSC
jgi:CPA1 family monovalent cation:H+ antiporter